MTKSYVRYKGLTLNSFPSTVGVSNDLSPANIVLGTSNLDANNFKIDFGTYAIVHRENYPTNSNLPRGIPAIALGPSGSTGGQFFMNLNTGAQLHARSWTSMAMHVLVKIAGNIPPLLV